MMSDELGMSGALNAKGCRVVGFPDTWYFVHGTWYRTVSLRVKMLVVKG